MVRKEQNDNHIVTSYPTLHPPHCALGISNLDDQNVEWLSEVCPSI